MNNAEATIKYMLSSLLFAFSFVVIQTRCFNEDIKIWRFRQTRSSNRKHIKKCSFTVGRVNLLQLSYNLPKPPTPNQTNVMCV